MDDPSQLALMGLDEQALLALDDAPGPTRIHAQLEAPLKRLASAARQAGFEMRVASGYRSFERQQAIWNAKATGRRALLDERGQPLDASTLSPADTLFAILRWSALPGASRHHWGTDIDVYDASALAEGQSLQLTREEAEGPFAPFHEWLSGYLNGPDNPGFFRPYDRDRGGVSPEPWHLSYAPLANRYARTLTLETLRAGLADKELALKEEVLSRLPQLFERFVRVPEGPEPLSLGA